MRLSSEIQHQLIACLKQYFGNKAHLYLFGSRVDDNKKGGDIDLFLETDQKVSLQTEIDFLKTVYSRITQRKIDLIIYSPEKIDRPIFQTAKKEGVLLC